MMMIIRMGKISIIIMMMMIIMIGNDVINGQYINGHDICKANEIYLSCGPSCPRTCEDIFNPDRPRICTMDCRQGCFCKEQLVRNTKNNQCIRPEQCSNGFSTIYVKTSLIVLTVFIAILAIEV